MKKILLLSDTHNHIDDAIRKHAAEADEVWHAGDMGSLILADELEKIRPLRAVYGNIDDHKVRSAWPEHLHFSCEDVTVWMTHIGGYPARYAPGIKNGLEQYKPGLFICGHSHLLRVMRDKQHGLLYMNPGAAGISGFHHVRTMLRFVINGKEITDVAVIELGLRGSAQPVG